MVDGTGTNGVVILSSRRDLVPNLLRLTQDLSPFGFAQSPGGVPVSGHVTERGMACGEELPDTAGRG